MSLQQGELKDILMFPLDVYLKENGYLGIVGFDSAQNDFHISSKSTVHGKFADVFCELFQKTLSSALETELLEFLHTQNVTLVFEVIEPDFDPHMIEYAHPRIVLLDVIYRTPEFKKFPYVDVVATAKRFGFNCKERTHRFTNWDEFYAWYMDVSADFSLEIEGYILEDANGFMTKIKLPYYRFWKWMRSVKDKIARHKALPDAVIEDPLGREFSIWAMSKRDDLPLADTDIITLRKLFYKEKNRI
ncbi:hypothetical protein CN918_27375 [Priestia megaterium]|nr:hypothetical protein CN918_27375 [Priestia megaterium]